jgi:putative transcriptional regulator
MTIHHHPSDDSILAYVNGSLGRTLALALGAHLDGCEQCRQSLGLAEALGGAFLEAESPAELDERAFSKLSAHLDMPQAEASPPPPSDIKPDIAVALPASLAHRRIGARRWLVPGIWIRPVLKDRAEGTRVYLLGAAPGKSLPRHGHTGVEMTQVIKGEFFDGGTRYGPGDFLEASSDIEHSLMVGTGEECICVIASQGVPRGLPGLLMRLLA